MDTLAVSDISSSHPPTLPGSAPNAELKKLGGLFQNEVTEMSTVKLDSNFMNATYQDEATRLLGRFANTVDTLNQILTKV